MLQGDILHKIFQGIVLVHIVGHDLHSEAMTDAAHGSADFAGSDDAGSLLIEIETHQPAQAEIIFPYLIVSLVQTAVAGQRQGHGMLRHRFRGVARDTHDTNVIFFGSVQIHVVEAGAAHQDQPHISGVQDFHGPRADIGADKGAHGIEAFRQGGGPGIQVGFGVLNGDFRKVFHNRFKAFPVIAFGVIK